MVCSTDDRTVIDNSRIFASMNLIFFSSSIILLSPCCLFRLWFLFEGELLRNDSIIYGKKDDTFLYFLRVRDTFIASHSRCPFRFLGLFWS